MKRFKVLFYVIALALIMVGAAGVTKVSASSVETYKLTWNVPANCSVKVFVSEVERNSGDSFNEGVTVDISLTAPSGFVMEVTSSDVELTKFGQGYSFEMPAKAVNLTISMGSETQTSPSPSLSPTPTAAATVSFVAAPHYSHEYIVVKSDEQVYYQVVKSAEPGELKPANWVKAAKDKNYYIDFSSLANGKDTYIALTTDNAAKNGTVVTIDSVVKSVKVTLNYKTEEITKGLADVIKTLNVKGFDSSDDNAEGTPADYSLKWKRGANGTWAVESEFTQLQWDMLKASNGTLYVTIDGKVKDEEVTYFRFSKEAKVKIPKSAKAPTVKVDYVKGTIALKNGMQVRVNEDTDWMDVIAYDKESKGTDVFALATAGATTGKKVSAVTVAELVAAVKDDKLLNQDDDVKDGAEVTLTVRTAATDKKFPSMEGTMKLVLPETEPAMTESTNIRCTAADKTNDVEAEFEINFADLILSAEGIKYEEYEYALVGKIADGVNLTKQKWTKIPSDGKVDLSKSIGKDYSWFKEGEDKATKFKYEDMDGILVRKAAVKATKEVTGVFASAYRTIDVTVMVTESENSSQNPGDDTEWDIKEDSPGTIGFIVDGNQVEKAKPGTKVTINIFMLSMPNYEVDKVTVYTHYETSSQTEEVIQPDANGAYIFTMPVGHVTVVVSEKAKES